MFLLTTVKDQGIGIKQEDIPTLFSEFGMIEESRNINQSGLFIFYNNNRDRIGFVYQQDIG